MHANYKVQQSKAPSQKVKVPKQVNIQLRCHKILIKGIQIKLQKKQLLSVAYSNPMLHKKIRAMFHSMNFVMKAFNLRGDYSSSPRSFISMLTIYMPQWSKDPLHLIVRSSVSLLSRTAKRTGPIQEGEQKQNCSLTMKMTLKDYVLSNPTRIILPFPFFKWKIIHPAIQKWMMLSHIIPHQMRSTISIRNGKKMVTVMT